MLFALFLGFPALSSGARIQGQVTNGTTNRPLVGQQVELISPQGGMAVVGKTTTGAGGRFTFDSSQIKTGMFYLLQANYQGVDYNAPVKFDSNGNALAGITAYESTHQKPALRATSARVIIRAEGKQARIQDLFAINNPLKRSYANPQGTFFFHIPAEINNPTVAVAGLMNMPLPQEAESGKKAGDFHISYALKPGLTVVMVAYQIGYQNKVALADSIPYPIDRAQLFVLPADLQVTSKIFSPDGTDAQSGSQKLQTQKVLAANAPLAAEVSGEAAAAASQQASAGQQEQVKEVPDSVRAVGIPLLLCFLLVLLWALGIRATKEYPRWKARQKGSAVQKKYQAKMETVLNSIADLDELFAARKIPEKQYWKERLELKAKATAMLKKGPSKKHTNLAAGKASQ